MATSPPTDENPFQPPADDHGGNLREGHEPQTFREAMFQGVRLGLKWASLITGPLAAIALLPFVGVFVFRFCFVEGTALLLDGHLRGKTLYYLGGPFGFYFVSCFWGVVIGLLTCPTIYVIKRLSRTSVEPTESNQTSAE